MDPSDSRFSPWSLRAGWWLLFVAAVLVALSASGADAAAERPIGWSQGGSLPGSYVGRWDFSYAYFPPTESVVMFGGSPKDLNGSFRNDTWVYQGGSWRQGPAAPAGLTPRGGAAMAYYPDIGKAVLFGGQGSSWSPLKDTWLFDGTKWTQGPAAPAAMAGRTGAEMVYDPGIGKLVLFGGSGLLPYKDTWLFDGTTWSAGPAAPAGMGPRTFFGMTYDPILQRVVVAGGTGGLDTWYFNGTQWSRGPDLPPDEQKERFRMDFSPQLGGTVIVGGLGPGMADGRVWLLRNGAWEQLFNWNDGPWPSSRLDAGVVWNPAEDALMVFGGIADDFNLGQTALTDTWFFRDVAPQVSSLSIGPTSPTQSDSIIATPGPPVGGYGSLKYEWAWYVNGTLVPGVTTNKLVASFAHGDEVEAAVRLSDYANVTGPWAYSNSLTVINRTPTIGKATIKPASAYPTSTLNVTSTRVKDKDGDAVTLHYEWSVNGAPLSDSDRPTLGPGIFQPGDKVKVTVTTVDSFGDAGQSATSRTVTVVDNITAGSGIPGDVVPGVTGGGFGPGEQVDIRLDSPTGSILATVSTDSSGKFVRTPIPLPSPLGGGGHHFYGVGRISGLVGGGPFTVEPTGSLSVGLLAAGDATTFTGTGFVPERSVSVWFPDGPVVQQVADAQGSVSVNLVSPPEPYGGGDVTASDGIGTTTVDFNVMARFTLPATGQPQEAVAFTLTGYGANETVGASFDTGPVTQNFVADASGSVSATMNLDTTWGRHDVKMTGDTSALVKTSSILLQASMSLSPNSGPVGTVITVQSGPGWIPGETVHVYWGATLVKDVTADPNGAVSTTYTVPAGASGAKTMKLKDDVLLVQPTATFTVT